MVARPVHVFVHTRFVSGDGEGNKFYRPAEKHRHRCDATVRGKLLLFAENDGNHERTFRLRRLGDQATARAHAKQRIVDADQFPLRDPRA